ncbi:MAG: hypothetical protein H3C49_02340 [Alphaproteobacteria bacterium]|mgnify:FL=1|nr:hypothetical protein [Alphaproteobacteria bacterium]HRI77134.1 hypothetical protein [Alphaproteobacteria bacterium]
MTHKEHFDSKASRPAASDAAPVQAAVQVQENGVKVVHHGPGFMRPQ